MKATGAGRRLARLERRDGDRRRRPPLMRDESNSPAGGTRPALRECSQDASQAAARDASRATSQVLEDASRTAGALAAGTIFIDDSDDAPEEQGAPGATGPTGATGATGPAGPTGPTG